MYKRHLLGANYCEAHDASGLFEQMSHVTVVVPGIRSAPPVTATSKYSLRHCPQWHVTRPLNKRRPLGQPDDINWWAAAQHKWLRLLSTFLSGHYWSNNLVTEAVLCLLKPPSCFAFASLPFYCRLIINYSKKNAAIIKSTHRRPGIT